MGGPAEGWYVDPEGSGRQRWWDGSAWTEHYAGPPPPQGVTWEAKERKGPWWKGPLAITVVVLAFGVCTAVVSGGAGGPSDAGARVVCEQFVEGRLKSPATASFPVTSRWRISENTDGLWTASAHVDSQNSFGATVRSPFTCKLRHIEGDRWRLVDLEVR